MKCRGSGSSLRLVKGWVLARGAVKFLSMCFICALYPVRGLLAYLEWMSRLEMSGTGRKNIWDYEAAGCCQGVVMRHKSWFDGSGCLDQTGHGLSTAEILSSSSKQERGLFWSLDDVDLVFWFITPPIPNFRSFSFIFHACSLTLCLSSWWTDNWQAYGCLWWEGAALLRWIWGQWKEKIPARHWREK